MLKPAILAVAFAALAAPAFAHHTEDHNDGAQHQHHHAISQERAVEIAREQGVANVREVEMDDGNWKIEGTTSEGRHIEVEVHPETGAIVKREVH
jgi:uncharacterized membrane protein YkoI